MLGFSSCAASTPAPTVRQERLQGLKLAQPQRQHHPEHADRRRVGANQPDLRQRSGSGREHHLRAFEVMPGVDVYGWIGLNLFQVLVPGALGSLLCATAYMLVCWLLGYVLDRRNIVVSD
jgi:hypothetical protein